MTSNNRVVPYSQILPAESREVQMPAGTPLGLGFLGAARFSAIRRVLEHAARAANAQANLISAQGAIATALVGREVAREQLNNIDTIRQEVSEQITEGAEIARLKRRLERIELEDQIAAKEAARAKARAVSEPTQPARSAEAPPPKPDDYTVLMNDLGRMPEMAKAAATVKEQIIRDAGGEDNVGEGTRQMIETIDAIMAGFVQKQAEGRLL
jgi:hypothetical protein